MWSEEPTSGTWLSNPQSVKVGDRLGEGDLGIGIGRVPERQERFLCIDQTGVNSCENLGFCVVQFIERRPSGRAAFKET